MKISVVYEPFVQASASPYRLRDEDGRELDWANAFLDAQRLRQLSLRSLRIYAYDLLHFARWFEPKRLPLTEITESTIVDYVRYQLDQDPKPTPQTVNHRLGVASEMTQHADDDSDRNFEDSVYQQLNAIGGSVHMRNGMDWNSIERTKGTWDFSGGHYTPNDASVVGPLYVKAGLRYGMFGFTASVLSCLAELPTTSRHLLPSGLR